MSPPATLLTFPRELRDEIYGYLLAGEPTTSNRDACIRRIFHTGILGVSKQLHHESEKFLVQKHSFVMLHYVGNQKSFDHEAFAPFIRYGIPIVRRSFQTRKPSPCTRLQLALKLKCLDSFFGDTDEGLQEQHSLHSFLICSSDFVLVSRIAEWSFPWVKMNAVYVPSTAPATLWIREAGQGSRSFPEQHALICTDVSFSDRSSHYTSKTSHQELIINTCRFICPPDGPNISGLESVETAAMKRRMAPKVFVLTKMMADLLKTAQYLKARADRFLAEGRKEGAMRLYAAFLQSYRRSTRPLLVPIKAEMLCQDPKCAEYICRIIEIAFNVQMTVISADALTLSASKAIELLDDFFSLFFDKFLHMLPQVYDGITSTLVDGFHLELFFRYPRSFGIDLVVERLKILLQVRPSDERLSHDLNLAKKLQARTHDEQDRDTLIAELQQEWKLSFSLTVFPRRPFMCATDHYVVPQSFDMEGWEPGNGPYRLSPAEQQAVHDLQAERS